MLVIEKIPPGYSTEFVEKRSVKSEIKNVYKEWKNSDVIHLGSKPDFETIDLKNCVRSKQFVIRNQNELLNALRSDASRDWCLENLPEIDFTENSLIGIELTTDYCTRPKGLKYEILRDAENKKLFFNISYDDAQGNRCARIGFYDISLLVPKIPGEWEVKFDVKINPPENR